MALEDKVDSSRDVPHGYVCSDHRRVLVGRLREFRRFRGTTIAAQVDEVYVVASLCDVIHPRFLIDLEVESTRGSLRRAVHVKDGLLGTVLSHPRRMLVANEESNSGITGFDHV